MNVPVMRECVIRLERIDLSKYRLCQNTEEKDDSKKIPEVFSKSYNLRQRELRNQPEKKTSKSIKQIVATSQAILYTSRAVRIWDAVKIDKSAQKLNVQIGDIVCGRMAGHRPWPGSVLSFKKTGTELKFFGTNDRGCVKKTDVVPIEFCKSVIEEYLKVPMRDLCAKTMNYHMLNIKATREISGINRHE